MTSVQQLLARAVAAAAVMAFLGAAPPLSAQAEKKAPLEAGALPEAVKRAIQKDFPKAEVIEAERETEGQDPGQIDVVLRQDGKVYELEFAPDGTTKEKKEIESAMQTDKAAEAEDENEPDEGGAAKAKKWTSDFDIGKCTFATTGGNRYFILDPGHQIVLQSKDETVTITALNETKMIGAVETRVVEEREAEDGKLNEVSRNFFAVCKETGDVFYFGEEVDEYKDGQIRSHSGAWRADDKDSKAGIIMPGRALLGSRHYQEMAPTAKDRAEIIADGVVLKTPAGEFKDCIRVEETSGLNPKEKGFKVYAPGVGLIQDEDLLLTSRAKIAQ